MGVSEKHVSDRDGRVAGPNKTPFAGLARGKRMARERALAALAFLAFGAAGCGGHMGEGKDCGPGARPSPVSGYCVPRYVSLKRDKVYARKGPGVDYPALWIYRAKGLPVQIVAETLDWRRVCDPDGGAVWVHRSMVDGRRSVEALGSDPLPLQASPKAGAHVVGLLNVRALAGLDRCTPDGWCKLKVGGVTGWAPANRVWGVAPAAQCR